MKYHIKFCVNIDKNETEKEVKYELVECDCIWFNTYFICGNYFLF